ncbi:hypothetical protein BH20ACT9_BH20ACT9_07630 [soil metagenome]
MGTQRAGPGDVLTRAAPDDRPHEDERTVDARAATLFLDAEAVRLLPWLRRACDPPALLEIVAGHDDGHGRWLDVCALAGCLGEGLADLVVELYCCHGRLVASLQRDALGLLPAATARRVLDLYAAELSERTMAVVEALDASGDGSSPRRP